MTNKNNILVVTGGTVDVVWAARWLENEAKKTPFDYCIAADSGLDAADALGIHVDYLLGDYDSVKPEVLARYRNTVETVTFPREKDYTDTELAFQAVIQLTEQKTAKHRDTGQQTAESKPVVTVLGATGTRFDHTLANVSLLAYFAKNKIPARLLDKHNCIRMLAGEDTLCLTKLSQYGSFVSCLAIGGEVTGLTLTGFRYPLTGAVLQMGVSLGVSNEIVDAQAKISIKSGQLLVIESRD